MRGISETGDAAGGPARPAVAGRRFVVRGAAALAAVLASAACAAAQQGPGFVVLSGSGSAGGAGRATAVGTRGETPPEFIDRPSSGGRNAWWWDQATAVSDLGSPWCRRTARRR